MTTRRRPRARPKRKKPRVPLKRCRKWLKRKVSAEIIDSIFDDIANDFNDLSVREKQSVFEGDDEANQVSPPKRIRSD